MATEFLNFTLDGVTDIPRLPGQGSVSWNTGGTNNIDHYEIYVSNPDDLDATVNITGSDWRVEYMQIAGDDNITRIQDLDDGANRRFEVLQVGRNSDVDLISTRVAYLEGWEGGQRHDITIGEDVGFINSVSLGAETNVVNHSGQEIAYLNAFEGRALFTVSGGRVNFMDGDDLNDRFIVEDGARVSFASTGPSGDDRVIVRDEGRITTLHAFGGNNSVTVSGDDSRIETFSGGDGDTTLTLNGESQIRFLDLYDGDNTISISDTARINNFSSGAGTTDLTLNDDARMQFYNVYNADANITINDEARLSAFEGGRGDFNIDLNGNGRIGSIKVNEDSFLTLVSEDGFIETIEGYQASSNITLGTGSGTDSINFNSSSAQSHTITTLEGAFVESIGLTDRRLDENDDQTSTINLGWFTGTVQLGNGDDVVTLDGDEASATTIATSGGDDLVILDGLGAGAVFLSRGDDTVMVTNLFDEPIEGVEFGNVHLRGGTGSDTVDFSDFDGAISVSLARGTRENFLSDNDRAFVIDGFENLVGTTGNDSLTGTNDDNMLAGGRGQDTLIANAGDDEVLGGNGVDALFGRNGNDMLDGGNGNDVLSGENGNDNLTGGAGRDVFVFARNAGADRVTDWTDGADILRLTDQTGGFNSLSIRDQNANLRIDHDHGVIILEGQAGTVLTAADFDFA